jgi:hypothetical protein
LEANLPYICYVEWEPYTAYTKRGNQILCDNEPMPGGHGFFYSRVFDRTKETKYLKESWDKSIVSTKWRDKIDIALTRSIEVMLFGDDKGYGQVRYRPTLNVLRTIHFTP